MLQAVSPVMWYVPSQQANTWLLSAVVKIVLVIKLPLNSESILLLAFLLKKLKIRNNACSSYSVCALKDIFFLL